MVSKQHDRHTPLHNTHNTGTSQHSHTRPSGVNNRITFTFTFTFFLLILITLCHSLR
jgi:hypothetical protein